MDQEKRDVRGGDAGDPRCLADRLGPLVAELLLCFAGQPANRPEIEPGWYEPILLRPPMGDLNLLPLDVASIFGGDLNLFDDVSVTFTGS